MRRLFLILLLVPASAQGAIQITNHADGEALRYPVPLLKGQTGDLAVSSVTVTNSSSNRPTHEMTFPVYKGQLKALAELVPGPNRLKIRCGDAETSLTVTYKPQTNPYFVRCVYMTDSTGQTEYQSQLDHDPQNYADKLDTAMKLMQTFTAERMNDLGFGHATFNLELDENGKVKVHLFKEPSPAETYYAMPDQAWWARVNREIAREFPGDHAKNFVMAAYTRFDPATAKTRGHTALGGGNLGLFGSGSFFTWPNSLADVPRAFSDTTRIDNTRVQNDSAGRNTFWGAASTTMGACLHETGHTFGLPHTREGQDIMTRGFDRFNRAFMVTEPSGRDGKPHTFPDDRIACWPPISAEALLPCRWFALDEKKFTPENRVTVRLDGGQGVLQVESRNPLRYVGCSVRGEAVYFMVPKENQARLTIPLADIREKTGNDSFDVRTIDDSGNITLHPASSFVKPASAK